MCPCIQERSARGCVQEVVGARARFPKPLEVYDLLASFGSNILVTEGDEWKRQRKIAAPAFSEVRVPFPRIPLRAEGRRI